MEYSSFYDELIKYTIFLDEEDFQKVNRSRQIYTANTFVCSELIKRILEDDKYYSYVKKYFMNEIENFQVAYIKNNDIGESISYTKNQIVCAMEEYIRKNNVNANKALSRFSELKELISINKLKENYSNKRLEIDIENNHYSIDISLIVSYLSFSNEDFKSFCDNKDISYIDNIPKDYFIYSMVYFIKKENIKDNYYLPHNVNLNIVDLLSFYYDVEALNKFLTTEDKLYQQITIDKELEEKVLNDMPNNLSLIEQAIFVYIMLCKLLTYDEEFRALNEENIVNEKHKDFHNVEKISLRNNRVVCYEFNLIYTKFLSILGINFQSNYKAGIGEENYGNGHVFLKFRVGKYLLMEDATDHIFNGDIALAKQNLKLTGLTSINKNKKTQKEFDLLFERVYRKIAEKEKRNLYEKESFYDIVSAYQKKISNYEKIDLKRKVDILVDKVNSSLYFGVDAMSYLLHLKEIIFDKNERMFNIKINIVTNYNTGSDLLGILTAVISINKDNLVGEDGTEYYIFTPNKEFKSTSFEELKNCFINGIFDYLEFDTSEIRGIKRGNYDK